MVTTMGEVDGVAIDSKTSFYRTKSAAQKAAKNQKDWFFQLGVKGVVIVSEVVQIRVLDCA